MNGLKDVDKCISIDDTFFGADALPRSTVALMYVGDTEILIV